MCNHDRVFDSQYYISLIFNREIEKAIKYKNENVPLKIYKYISLDAPPACNALGKDIPSCLELNECRMLNLKNKELWLSSPECLNDPFEFKAFYLDKEILEQKGYPIEDADWLLESMKMWLVGSFTTNLTQSMPMWAHYTNNHKGYCVEYTVEDPKYIFPISYETERFKVAKMIAAHVRAAYKYSKGEKLTADEEQEVKFYSLVLFHGLLVKHESWSYENEYRLCVPKDALIKKGVALANETLGIRATNIYLGINCEQGYRRRLKEIAIELGMGIKEMYFDEEAEGFELAYKDF